MSVTISAADVPTASLLFATLDRAHFHDAYSAPLADPSLLPAEIALRVLGASPPWVERLMALRNWTVRRIGLKDVGSMRSGADKSGRDLQVGDRLGIFRIFALTQDEILLGIDDHHLDVRVSVRRSLGMATSAAYTVSTAVYTKNWLGRLYMLPVARIHPLVVRAGMRRASV
ncbi:MAG: DUF2867 domain-containing protein [Ancalomicrobiaceae bacterium]|nr:DUF2867 domain-containing protein [Ancalomicrobiaceae bacterium]